MQKPLFISLTTLLLVSCAEPQAEKEPSFDLSGVREEIQAKTVRFGQAHFEKDTAYLNNIFSEDARVFAPGSAPTQGRVAISQVNEEWVNYGIYTFTEKSTRSFGNEEYFVDEGSYLLVYGPDSTREAGNYLNVWKNVDGEWKVHSNIWNATTTE